jgi:membrane-associated progesterone receptor component
MFLGCDGLSSLRLTRGSYVCPDAGREEMNEAFSAARELVRGSEITIGTVVIGVVVWRLMTYKPSAKADKKDEKKAPSANVPHTNKKPPAKKEELVYREDWTFQELKAYNGTDPNKPLLVAIKGQIYDVSAKPDMYGQGGSYAAFAGVDASYMLGTMNIDATGAQANKAFDNLSESEEQSLSGWETFFNGKYTIVGKIPLSEFA